MSESTDMLMLEFLSWVSARPRTYDEAMEAWQSHCPRQTIWEDAIMAGYIQIKRQDTLRGSEITLTPRGKDLLNGNNGALNCNRSSWAVLPCPSPNPPRPGEYLHEQVRPIVGRLPH